MSPEFEHPRLSPEAEAFGLTHHEDLFDRVGDARLQMLLTSDKTTIHKAQLDSNSYGEFMFLTLSREHNGKRHYVMFYGLGFHEQRERWIVEEWQFFSGGEYSASKHEPLTAEQAQKILTERRSDVQTWAKDAPAPSKRAHLFEMLADLTDEDGAYAELEDMGDIDWFDDE
jgi:hypothetical protein